jgi:hypothetical protein
MERKIMEGHQRPSDTVPHQDEHEDLVESMAPGLVDAQLAATSDHAAIASLATPSATYVEAEAVAMAGAINDILEVLRDAGLIPAA